MVLKTNSKQHFNHEFFFVLLWPLLTANLNSDGFFIKIWFF
ncbi:hypothetical protein SAMN02745866_03883 [Alteromonadaceae bacterium Bs31]|nr:hypothetical protein SAMN02745866_03883 [Alteromonadaceae bacterium Bs31]